MSQDQPDNLLTPNDAAKRLGVTKHALNNWRKNNSVNLPYVRIGRLVKYRASDLQAFIVENVQSVGVPRE